jgi:hypothetical protein
MAWYFGSAEMTVTEKSDANNQIIARLQPLASGTVHHIFGYEDQTSKITAVVVGNTDKDLLVSYTKTADDYSLYYDSGVTTTIYGNYLLKGLSIRRENVIKQSIRQDLACDAPVYSVELEVYKV